MKLQKCSKDHQLKFEFDYFCFPQLFVAVAVSENWGVENTLRFENNPKLKNVYGGGPGTICSNT